MAIDQRLFGIYSLNFFINAANSILAPFYPDEAIKKGVTKDIIGFIFSSHPIVSFLISLILGKMMHTWGRKKILILGLLFQSLGLAIFGSVIHIDQKYVFIAISALARTIQGVGFAFYGAVAYAYIPLLYPDSVQQKISFMEILTGLGLMLGPLIGGVLETLGGYQTPFYTMSGIFFIVTPFMLAKLPSDASMNLEADNNRKPVSIFKFLSNRKILCTFIVVVLPNCGMGFLQPTLSNHMKDYTTNTLIVSLMFSIGTLTYALSMPIIALLPKRIDRRVWLCMGIFFSAISYFLIGPEEYLNLPPSIAWVILALCILGPGLAMSMVPSIPEFMEIGSKLYPDDKESVGDMASGLFNSAYSAGALIGPILGGNLDEYFGFQRAESIYGIINVGYLIIYLTVGEAIFAFSSFRRKVRKVTLLSEDEEHKEDEENGKKIQDLASTLHQSKDGKVEYSEISPDNQVTWISPIQQNSLINDNNATLISPIDFRSVPDTNIKVEDS